MTMTTVEVTSNGLGGEGTVAKANRSRTGQVGRICLGARRDVDGVRQRAGRGACVRTWAIRVARWATLAWSHIAS